jgi:hypothetical protein
MPTFAAALLILQPKLPQRYDAGERSRLLHVILCFFSGSCIKKLAIPLGMYHTFIEPYFPIKLVITPPALVNLDSCITLPHLHQILLALEGCYGGANIKVSPVVGQRYTLCQHHMHKLMCFSFLFICAFSEFQNHVQLVLLLVVQMENCTPNDWSHCSYSSGILLCC